MKKYIKEILFVSFVLNLAIFLVGIISVPLALGKLNILIDFQESLSVNLLWFPARFCATVICFLFFLRIIEKK